MNHLTSDFKASALEQIEEQGNRMGNRASWLPEIRGVAENSPSVLASLSPPAEHDLVSLKNAGSDSTRGPPEPHAPEEVQFKQPDLSHLYPSTSVVCRILECQINELLGKSSVIDRNHAIPIQIPN